MLKINEIEKYKRKNSHTVTQGVAGSSPVHTAQ